VLGGCAVGTHLGQVIGGFDRPGNNAQVHCGRVLDVPGDAYRRWLPASRVTLSVRQIMSCRSNLLQLVRPKSWGVRDVLKCKDNFAK
jgi:hypothetical protein